MTEFTNLQKLTLTEFIERVFADAKAKANNNGTSKIFISTRKLNWIYLIKMNHLTCPVTNKKVAYCSYDRKKHNIKTKPTFHYNFYAADGDLFTIDHKIPISQGGKKNTNNIQPMIAKHNFAKGISLTYM